MKNINELHMRIITCITITDNTLKGAKTEFLRRLQNMFLMSKGTHSKKSRNIKKYIEIK